MKEESDYVAYYSCLQDQAGSSCSGLNVERLTWPLFDALWCSEGGGGGGGEGAAYICQGQLKDAGLRLTGSTGHLWAYERIQ